MIAFETAKPHFSPVVRHLHTPSAPTCVYPVLPGIFLPRPAFPTHSRSIAPTLALPFSSLDFTSPPILPPTDFHRTKRGMRGKLPLRLSCGRLGVVMEKKNFSLAASFTRATDDNDDEYKACPATPGRFITWCLPYQVVRTDGRLSAAGSTRHTLANGDPRVRADATAWDDCRFDFSALLGSSFQFHAAHLSSQSLASQAEPDRT